MNLALVVVATVGLATAPDQAGDAAFSYRIKEAAANRGIELQDPGCALALDCSRIGEEVWVRVDGRFVGPLTVVDCGAAHHREWLREKGRVIDLPWSLWDALGLPLAPHPVELYFGPLFTDLPYQPN